MKYYYLYIVILGVLACDLGNEKVKIKYVLENGTNRDIKIDFYKYSFLRGSAEKKSSGLIIEGYVYDYGRGSAGIRPTYFNGCDSVVVIYDDKKRQIYYFNKNGFQSQPQTVRNILEEDAYIKENKEMYRFIFTEEDYESAENL